MSGSARALAAGFTVRPMVPADAARFAEVHVAVWREAYAGLMPDDYLAGLDPAVFRSRWAQGLSTPRDDVVHLAGLAPDGTVMGGATAGTSRDPDPVTALELWAINVLRAVHGTGLADLLVETLLGDEPASLWVVAGNDRARAFYRRHGFEDDGATKPFAPTGALELRMVRGLTGKPAAP